MTFSSVCGFPASPLHPHTDPVGLCSPRPKTPAVDRIMRRVTVSPTGCWIWTGPQDRDGYGRVGQSRVHRFTYEQWRGPIPKGLEIDHLCRVRSCCNPLHLEAATHQENARRRPDRALRHGPQPLTDRQRKNLACKYGHEFTPENTRWIVNGHRACRECGRLRHRTAQPIAAT